MDTHLPAPVNPHVHHPKVESFYERNAVALQWGIIGVAFVAACGIYWWRMNSAVEANALVQFVLAQDVEDYASIATDSPGTHAASWSKLREANGYLDTAVRDAFSNREKANTDLGKAVELLESLKKAGGPAELQEQVLFAHARSLEMTSDGKLEPAIEAYETFLKRYPESQFKREAQKRVHSLQRKGAEEFYAFFAKQNPKPAEPARPNDEKAGSKTGAGAGHEDPLKPITFGGGDKSATDGGPSFPLLAPLLDKSKISDEDAAIPELKRPKKDDKTAPDSAPAAKADEKAGTPEKPATKPDEAKPADAKTDAAKTEESKKDETKPETDKPAEKPETSQKTESAPKAEEKKP